MEPGFQSATFVPSAAVECPSSGGAPPQAMANIDTAATPHALRAMNRYLMIPFLPA
jgi:hypothetical protein